MEQKLEHLKCRLAECGSLAVAFSGGVDSAFLLKTAHDVLGSRVLAVTIRACVFPQRETEEAAAFCQAYGIPQRICTVDPLQIQGFAQNPKNRCYLCKRQMMQAVLAAAKEQQAAFVAEGSNMDDEGDDRPGRQAAAELGVISPLREAGLWKAEIRELSRQMGLAAWDKPAYACLASRFVYGECITPQKLAMVDQAEQLLLDMGFRQMRVRMHGNLARIEALPQDFDRMMSEPVRARILEHFREYGFTYVAVDMQGYRTGSMNEG